MYKQHTNRAESGMLFRSIAMRTQQTVLKKRRTRTNVMFDWIKNYLRQVSAVSAYYKHHDDIVPGGRMDNNLALRQQNIKLKVISASVMTVISKGV